MSVLNEIVRVNSRKRLTILILPIIAALFLAFINLDISDFDFGFLNPDSSVLSSSASKDGEYYLVTRVVDGDTLEIDIDGTLQKIRLIGVDTPETSDPRKEVECFGKEASNETKEAVEGKYVRLEADETQSDKDRYGRLLRYVFTDDSTNLNLFLIEQGYAYEYTYEKPYKLQDEFKTAEKQAREDEVGLWDPRVCPDK